MKGLNFECIGKDSWGFVLSYKAVPLCEARNPATDWVVFSNSSTISHRYPTPPCRNDRDAIAIVTIDWN